MEKVALSHLDAGAAARLLQGMEALDPRGVMRAADVLDTCSRGICFAATVPGGQMVYVLNVRNGQAWIAAAKGSAPVDLTASVLPVIEQQAVGLDSVAFQTKRPGLVRKARRQGYSIVGWIMKKDLR